jgi:hypothetical protein
MHGRSSIQPLPERARLIGVDLVLRAIQVARLLAKDGRIPRPLRGLAVVGLLPVPGPFDEAILMAVAILLWLFYRDVMADAWKRTGSS